MAEGFLAGRPGFNPPPGACDSHLHLFGPAADYPLAQARAYTPADALPSDALAMLATLGLERCVLVQPSVYGSDNRRLLDGLAALGPRARGVAVLDSPPDPAALERLNAAGVRGLRVNAVSMGTHDPQAIARHIDAQAAAIASRGWHLQLFLPADLLPPLARQLARLPVPVVLDHFASLPPAAGEGHPAFRALARLLETGQGWVKLSGAYRLPGDAAATDALARSLVALAPERALWGSDWPHTPPHPGRATPEPPGSPFRRLDTGRLLDRLALWAPDEALRRRVLATNPQRLYGFA